MKFLTLIVLTESARVRRATEFRQQNGEALKLNEIVFFSFYFKSSRDR